MNMEPMIMPCHSGLCFGCCDNHRCRKGHGTEFVWLLQNYPGFKSDAEKNIATLCKDRKSSVKLSKGGRGSSNKGGSKRSYIGDNPEFGRMSKTQKSAFAANLVSNKGELEWLQNIVTKGKANTTSSDCYTNEPVVFTIGVINAVE